MRRYVGIEVWKSDGTAPKVEHILASCGHLLVIVLLEGTVPVGSGFGRWLDNFNEFQRLPIGELGEYALRAGNLGLLALQNAWTLLGAGSE